MIAGAAARSACRAALSLALTIVAYAAGTAACAIVGIVGVSAAAVAACAALTMSVGIRHIVAVNAFVCAGV